MPSWNDPYDDELENGPIERDYDRDETDPDELRDTIWDRKMEDESLCRDRQQRSFDSSMETEKGGDRVEVSPS